MFLLTVIAAVDLENGGLLKKLVNEHSDRLYAIAYSYLKNHHDAKDVVQDVFISVYKNIEKFYDLERDETAALLVKYTRNRAIDCIRHKKRRPDTIPLSYEIEGEEEVYEIPDLTNIPEEKYLEKEALEKIAAFLETLPEAQRDTLVLKYKYGFTSKEIADSLKVSESVVTSRINRAKSKVLEFLKGEENG